MLPRWLLQTHGIIKDLILLIIFISFLQVLLPWLVEAQQQHQQALHLQPKSIFYSNPTKFLRNSRAFNEVDKSHGHYTWKNTLDSKLNLRHTSDIATLAPALSAVVAPSLRLSSRVNVETSSPQIARSLGDWEVEEFVLLSTVDGTLFACDRRTGKERWHISYEKPMVQIEHHPKSLSDTSKDFDPTVIDDYLWILEPSKDGTLYLYRPHGTNPGLLNTGLTMKKLVEMTPYGDEDPPVIYTGKKKTNVLTVDANTGKISGWFGSVNSLTTKEKCDANEELSKEKTEKCPRSANLILGRTEYTVGIFGRNDGHHIATLKFSEWSPNNFDQDLQRQYIENAATLDNKYIYTGYDGGIISLDYEQKIDKNTPSILFQHKFPSPVVRVFDVARTWGSDQKTPNLVILSQPQPPNYDTKESNLAQTDDIFLNHTEDGSWYAITSNRNPLIIDSIQQARCNQEDWSQCYSKWNVLNKTLLSEALVGLHSIKNIKNIIENNILAIAGPVPDQIDRDLSRNQSQLTHIENAPSLKQFVKLLHIAIKNLMGRLKSPLLLLTIIGFITFNQNNIRRILTHYFSNLENNLDSVCYRPKTEIASESDTNFNFENIIKSERFIGNVNRDFISKSQEFSEVDNKQINHDLDKAKTDTLKEEKEVTGLECPKKKTHRGRRGGVKHKKRARNNFQDSSTILDQKSAHASLSNSKVSVNTHNSVQQRIVQSDLHILSDVTEDTSGSSVRIGELVVNTDKLIGTGSNGTMVFKGRFDGREVAVKRMLIQFFDVALHETKLLRESDDHPNVIRYFAQQQAAGFLYIALELCPASLADLIENPLNHVEIAQAGEKDLPNILCQITHGIHHLHKLRIVHRDLKPQNILVSIDKDEKPRLVVSDFGLCKKLEGEQSSFHVTTAHAAGTSGWRAPELLLDDDSRSPQPTIFDTKSEDNSSSAILNSDLLPNRRATRAIDIFSLGLIFFYVLTKGGHPYDCGDRFMREVNIRLGKYDLRPLEILGDSTFEAKDLISNMLSAEPELRPQAHQVMAHPFFWSAKKRLNFLCDVSDHFEKEKRDPPTPALQKLEIFAKEICGNDFLKLLGKDFVDSMGKQRKYTGTRLLDLLRALRNKKNHYEDMSEKLKKDVGPLPDGYLRFWTLRFPQLLIVCWKVVYDLNWSETDRFRDYYTSGGL